MDETVSPYASCPSRTKFVSVDDDYGRNTLFAHFRVGVLAGPMTAHQPSHRFLVPICVSKDRGEHL